MRKLRTVIGVMCIACLAAAGVAQEASPPAPEAKAPAAPVMPQCEPVLQHIPADALGYVVVNNVGGLMDKVDGYMATIGLQDVLASQMPNGLLETVKGLAMLGDGFNPNGGFAVVLLDPAKFNVDLIAMIERGPTTRPDGNEEKVPVAILVPGTSVQGVFGNYPIAEAGKNFEVTLRMGKMFAGQAGGYVVLSPSQACLEAVLAQAPGAPSLLSAKQAELAAKSDISFAVNMSTAGPLIKAMMAKNMEQFERSNMPSFVRGFMSAYMGVYQDMLGQISGYAVGARIGRTGLVFEAQVEFKPDSFWGQTMASWRPPTEPLLNRLPDLSYIIAMGGPVQPGDQNPYKPMTLEFLDQLLAAAPKLDDQTKQDIKTWVSDWMDQITGMQVVGGGAPPDSGLFGVSCVLTCRDSAKVKDILMQLPVLIERIVKLETGKETMEFQFIVTQAAETVEGVSVNSVGIAPPATETMTEDDKAEITRVMGEDQIRFFIAPVDAHTVVVTFGGAKVFLAQAISTAKSGNGQILADPAVAPALEEMPAKPAFILLLNVGNGMSVLTHAATVMTHPQSAPPFQITAKTPIAVASAVEGSSVRAVYYIPTDLVTECVGIAKAFFIRPAVPMPETEPATEPVPAEGEKEF